MHRISAVSRLEQHTAGPIARLLPDLVGQIVEAVIDAICARRLPPGTKLGEAELARIFGTSRTTIRQALQHLSFVGVVHSVTNRGAFIAQTTRKQAADLYSARRVIEAETVAELARNATANDIRALRQHLALQREAELGGKRFEILRLRGDFHLLIARLAGNQALEDLLAQLLPKTALIKAFYGPEEATCGPTDEHEELIKLVASGDVDACVALMQAHLHLDERALSIPSEPQRPRIDLESALMRPDADDRGGPGAARPRSEPHEHGRPPSPAGPRPPRVVRAGRGDMGRT